MQKKVKYSLLFVSGKKQFYRMNGVRVLTVIDSANRAASVDRVRLFVTGAFQNTHAIFYLSCLFVIDK